MESTTLHITNGDSLTAYLKELNINGEFLIWREMLCEGPTLLDVRSEASFKIREQFLKDFYHIDAGYESFKTELKKLDNLNLHAEIHLWFEYDLFCHINLLAVVYLLKNLQVHQPIYLICSGRIKGVKDMKGLVELSPEQLLAHYEAKIELNTDDVNFAATLWELYNNQDHRAFKPVIVNQSNFKYLSNCLRAHLERFPDDKSGLDVLERNILSLIQSHGITSKYHLLGYSLKHQGFYGYGDLQLNRIIYKLYLFFDTIDGQLAINQQGQQALAGKTPVTIPNLMIYGGTARNDFRFSTVQQTLIKKDENGH